MTITITDEEYQEMMLAKRLYVELRKKIESQVIYLRYNVDSQGFKDIHPPEIRNVHRHYMYELEELLK